LAQFLEEPEQVLVSGMMQMDARFLQQQDAIFIFAFGSVSEFPGK